jgi:hypothetical protein
VSGAPVRSTLIPCRDGLSVVLPLSGNHVCPTRDNSNKTGATWAVGPRGCIALLVCCSHRASARFPVQPSTPQGPDDVNVLHSCAVTGAVIAPWTRLLRIRDFRFPASMEIYIERSFDHTLPSQSRSSHASPNRNITSSSAEIIVCW